MRSDEVKESAQGCWKEKNARFRENGRFVNCGVIRLKVFQTSGKNGLHRRKDMPHDFLAAG